MIPSRVCIHKEILTTNQFDETLNVSEDTELFTRIIAKNTIIQFDYYGAVYTIHNENTTNLKNNPFLGQFKSLNKIMHNPSVRPFVALCRQIILSPCFTIIRS